MPGTVPELRVLFASSYSKLGDPSHVGVRRYRILERTGDLVDDGVFGDRGYSFLAWERSRRLLVATSGGVGSGALTSFAAGSSGIPLALGTQPTGGEEPCHVSVTNDGRHVLVANYASGSISALPLDAAGAPQMPSGVVRHVGEGPDPLRQARAHIHMVYVDPFSSIVVAADLGADELKSYRVDGTGRLHPLWTVSAPRGSGPRHVVAVEGGCLAVTDELSSTVSSYSLDRSSGRLSLVDCQPASLTSPAGTRNYPSEIVTTSDRRTVYVANRGLDVVTVFAADSGRLSPLADWPCGGEWPRHMTLIGADLYIANQRSDSVTRIRTGNGRQLLARARTVARIPSPVCLLSPRSGDQL